MSRERDRAREIAMEIEKGIYNYDVGLEENERQVERKKTNRKLNDPSGRDTFNKYIGVSPEPMDFQYDPKTHNYFIQFALVMVIIMTIVTTTLIIYVMVTPVMKLVFKQNGFITTVSAIVLLITADTAVSFCPFSRKAPCNALVLALTVIAMSLLGARISAYFNTEIILYYLMSTIGTFFVLMISASNSFDFLKFQTYVAAVSAATAFNVLIILLTQIAMYPMKLLIMCIFFISTLLQAIMISNQLQKILSGRSIIVNLDEYDLAAFLIYTSILDVCVRIIHLYASKSERSKKEANVNKPKLVIKEPYNKRSIRQKRSPHTKK